MTSQALLPNETIKVLCFRFDALTESGALMRTEFLCVSVLRVASGPG